MAPLEDPVALRTDQFFSTSKVMSIGVQIIWGTRITTRQKAGVGIVFCLGIFIIVAAIVRAVEISDKAYTDIVGVGVWSVAESSICMRPHVANVGYHRLKSLLRCFLAMIVGCLPPFKEFVSRDNGSSKATIGGRETGSRTTGSSHIRNRSWSEIPLPLEESEQQVYRDLDYELYERGTTVVGGAGLSNSRTSTSEDGRPGEIRMTKEFVGPAPPLSLRNMLIFFA